MISSTAEFRLVKQELEKLVSITAGINEEGISLPFMLTKKKK